MIHYLFRYAQGLGRKLPERDLERQEAPGCMPHTNPSRFRDR